MLSRVGFQGSGQRTGFHILIYWTAINFWLGFFLRKSIWVIYKTHNIQSTEKENTEREIEREGEREKIVRGVATCFPDCNQFN